METRRQPLKRLCSDSSTESPRKRRFTVIDEEAENCDPLLSSGPEYSPKSRWHSLLRVAEQEIKPDTPAIPSVKSRIQRLHEISSKDLLLGSDGDSYSVGDKSWTEDSSVLTDSERKIKSADMAARLDISSVLEKFEWKPGMEEQTLLPPLAQSTIAHRRPLPSQEDKAPSGETASRLRKEREDELAMVCAVLDRRNPWRAESMRQKQKKSEEIAFLGSDFGEPSVDRSEKSLDFCEERSVSSLEVRLGGTIDSDSSKELSPQEQTSSSSLCKQSEDVQDGAVMSPGVENVRSQVTMDNSEFIDQLFEGVLDSSEGSEEHELDLPPMSVLSPLTKSIDLQAAISPLNSVVSSLPELLVDPPETSSSPLQDSQLLYSIDAYRTLRRNVQVDPGSQLSTKLQTDSSGESVTARIGGDTKELIKLLSKDVYSLQRIMEQSCRALSCCVDAEHGKGTRQEAEAERLLLLSEEKRKALLKELDRLRGEKPDVPEHNTETIKPCHATITISDIRLPLKVDYVCSTIRESGFPSHYFLILIRFGAYDIVATPLASAADAQTGDTILFPTTVTLKDVSSDFKIEIEVYSLAQANAVTMSEKRKTSKPKITPKKLLGSRKSTLNSPACSPAIGSILRSSNFLMVGSLTLSLESLGKFKFSLEKMKLEGKVGRILGNHFQDKVPFLSPLEGNLYLKIQCQSHSTVHRKGFLTMFDDVSGLGVWHRHWCVLSGNCLSFWTDPDQESCKEPLGQINLANCTSAKIEAATRERCARPHTLELITMRPQREDDADTLVTQCRNTLCFTKNWLSADTKEERNQWMDCLNQVLVDRRTWRSSHVRASPNQQGWQNPNLQHNQTAATIPESDC